MGEIKNEDTKTANQAWRKKPRKFAPKSRLGCKTCKIRRVKCDLSQPSCLKCQSTGRTCDGYNETALAIKTIEPSHCHNEKVIRAENCDSYHFRTTTSASQPEQWHSNHHGHILQNLGPFMIIPVTGPVQTDAMCFFEHISIKHLNEYHPCESWRNTLMFFSQTVPSVRYAAVALALVYRNYLDRDSSDRVHQSNSSEDCLPDKAPLLYYNRAIQLLLKQEIGDSAKTTAITLLVCYLFTCFDHLAGNYVQAMKHLRGGVELSRNIDNALLHDNEYDDTKSPGARTLISQITRQIRRLDMQAVMFLVDWTPADLQETLMPRLPPSDRAFRSPDQAADHLQILATQVMRLFYTEQQMTPTGQAPTPPLSLKDVVLGQLERWSSLFENMLQQSSAYRTGPEAHPLISLLRLQHTIAWILLNSYGPNREMAYDNFLPQFQQCVALASDVAAAHERYSGSLKPTFTPEVGIVPVLYIIGAKCRHPVVRREVLSILRRQPMKEAVWDSICTSRVLERVIEIEEAGEGEGEMTGGMERIVMWQRIETLSWVQSAARVDITYAFCVREGTHIESLVI
ncbi:hypothetical protein F5Y10DRAFT_240703 [Nemania abortiva]|nr:hypothetical protein F5Y10DRAFT_240703 [Nemania abortiva]